MIELRQILVVHVVVIALIALPCAVLCSPQQALDCLIAGAMIGLNIAAVVWTTKRIFLKKPVALPAFVIVIKYAAFIAVLVALHYSGWHLGIGFVLGLSSALPTVAIAAYRHSRQEVNGSV